MLCGADPNLVARLLKQLPKDKSFVRIDFAGVASALYHPAVRNSMKSCKEKPIPFIALCLSKGRIFDILSCRCFGR